MEPIRVLQYGLSGGLAGIENVIMDLYRNIDRDRIQFDFLMMNDEDPYFADEITNLGGRIYKNIYLRGKNPIKGTLWNYDFFSRHDEFSAIHCNVSSLLSIERILTPIVCRKIPQRIVHIHNAGDGKETPKQIKAIRAVREKLPKLATDAIACSRFAGKYAYAEVPFTSIPNCIDTQKYLFDKVLRERTRGSLGITNERVIGVVGRMRYQKNHAFLLEIFREILKKDQNYFLLMVGDGPLEDSLRKQADMLGISDRIIWAGEQNDVLPYYCAMDQYVMPSRYEGFGLVFLEAQLCGLPCVGAFYDAEFEANVTGMMEFVELSCTPEVWADRIMAQKPLPETERIRIGCAAETYHCDVKDYARRFEAMYLRRDR